MSDTVFELGFSIAALVGLFIVVRARPLAMAVYEWQRQALVSFSYEQALMMVRIFGCALVFMGSVAFLSFVASL